jgi:hypothetical protein
MKTKLLPLLGLLCLLSASVTAQEEKAIKAVIEKETSAFFNVDRKGWEESWLQVPYAYWSYSDSTGTNFIEGWDAVKKSFDDYFRTQVSSRQIDVAHQANNKPVTIDRTWKEIRIYGTGAYVRYNQRVKDDQIYRDETSQVRILEKKDGKWKVVCVGAIAMYPPESSY